MTCISSSDVTFIRTYRKIPKNFQSANSMLIYGLPFLFVILPVLTNMQTSRLTQLFIYFNTYTYFGHALISGPKHVAVS